MQPSCQPSRLTTSSSCQRLLFCGHLVTEVWRNAWRGRGLIILTHHGRVIDLGLLTVSHFSVARVSRDKDEWAWVRLAHCSTDGRKRSPRRRPLLSFQGEAMQIERLQTRRGSPGLESRPAQPLSLSVPAVSYWFIRFSLSRQYTRQAVMWSIW